MEGAGRLSEAEFEGLSLRGMFELLARRAVSDPRAAAALGALREQRRANPLLWAEPHSPAQAEFIAAMTRIVAAFAGNRFGKTTGLVWRALREVLPRESLPGWLQSSKWFDPPVAGWIVCPTEDKIFDSLQPAFERWTPPEAFLGGSWGRAFNSGRMELSFANGSSIAFKTYKQDPSTLGGASLWFVGYDEPPPRRHREECRMRLADTGGFEMFAMTPLEANTGYVRREVWKKREAPNVTVVKGSIHDNPTLNREAVDEILGDLSDLWRRAREFGDFVDVGGLIYPEFGRCVAKLPWAPEFVRGLDVVVGVDPGIRNCGVVFVGFDGDLAAYVFAARLLQDATPRLYAAAIRHELMRWGLSVGSPNVSFVCDPAARQRGQSNAQTVQAALALEGVFAASGQNDVQAGIGQLRTRMAHSRFYVSPERTPGLLGLRDEAEEYAAREPREGADDSHLEPVKSHDHRLDALRYAVMQRFWDPVVEDEAPDRVLGWQPEDGIPDRLALPQEFAPMGPLS